MKRYILFLACALCAILFTSCGEKEFYNDEQYRKECYIVSDDNNIFGQEYTFGENAIGYLSLYMSGSTPVEHDVVVTLRPAEQLLKDYNQRVFGTSYDSYAEILPADSYYAPEGWTTKMTADNPYTLFPIAVSIDQLDPAKIYYLPIEIASVDDYQYSENKSYVLYQIYMKNAYATTKKDTYYQMFGTTIDLVSDGTSMSQLDPVAVPTVFNATKKMLPVSENAVSVLPGSTQTSSDLRYIKITITDEIYQCPVTGDDGLPTGKTIPVNKVQIVPKNEGSACVQVAKAYDAYTGEELTSYYNPADNTFTLNYCFRMPNEKSGNNELWHKVHEEMARLN